MRTLIALLVLVPTLASAQFTQAQRNGLVKSLNDAVASVQGGEVPTIINGTRVTFGGTVPINTPCIRCSVYLDDDNVRFLGLNPEGALLTGSYNRYAVLQVCGAATATFYEPPPWLRDLVQTCSTSPILATAIWPRVTVAHRTDPVAQTAATGFACACRQATGTCTVGGQPAKFGTTLAPGTYTGAGCLLKTCVELYGFESYPPECPLQ